ncbi:hypothetical protein CKAH01_06818 [Colletotrichum kahawae]|uniref:Uncharacterized protein n=1 Tax=Colletotrichum kahawae TaxID=34407 RepID=A0AAD9YA83_COLKA|nr:hypothetical protein CKAH01_06818 [Colletotrichum kahawae]
MASAMRGDGDALTAQAFASVLHLRLLTTEKGRESRSSSSRFAIRPQAGANSVCHAIHVESQALHAQQPITTKQPEQSSKHQPEALQWPVSKHNGPLPLDPRPASAMPMQHACSGPISVSIFSTDPSLLAPSSPPHLAQQNPAPFLSGSSKTSPPSRGPLFAFVIPARPDEKSGFHTSSRTRQSSVARHLPPPFSLERPGDTV